MTLSACAAWQRPIVNVSPSAVPALSDDLDAQSFRTVVERTAPFWEQTGRLGTLRAARQLATVLETTPDPVARQQALASAFRVQRVRDPLLLTSYYEPEIRVRERPDAVYRHPIYRRPPDLTDPYYTRAQIDAGALAGRGLELAWTDDALQLFLLQVQGSGKSRFPDGHVAAIRYAGTNGQPYKSLGLALVQHGLLPKDGASLFAIRRAFATLPEAEQRAYMQENPRFVFFTMTDAAKGPIGSMGVELTPMRSVATDPALLPAGTIGYVVTPTIRRFVVAQDIGGAVKGAHADLYAGSGQAAEDFAGRQKERGVMYVFAPL